jgi:hypothetical protein
VARQAGIIDVRHRRVLGKPLSQNLRVFLGGLQAHLEGFDAAGQQKAVKGGRVAPKAF